MNTSEYFVSVSSKTNCSVLLQLTDTVSVCKLQHNGNSALQQAGDQQIQAKIIGEVERVGKQLSVIVFICLYSYSHTYSTQSAHSITNTRLVIFEFMNYKYIHIFN